MKAGLGLRLGLWIGLGLGLVWVAGFRVRVRVRVRDRERSHWLDQPYINVPVNKQNTSDWRTRYPHPNSNP